MIYIIKQQNMNNYKLRGAVIISDEKNGIGDKISNTMWGTKMLDIDTKCATKYCENRNFRGGTIYSRRHI